MIGRWQEQAKLQTRCCQLDAADHHTGAQAISSREASNHISRNVSAAVPHIRASGTALLQLDIVQSGLGTLTFAAIAKSAPQMENPSQCEIKPQLLRCAMVDLRIFRQTVLQILRQLGALQCDLFTRDELTFDPAAIVVGFCLI
jgi:hypothetical protein